MTYSNYGPWSRDVALSGKWWRPTPIARGGDGSGQRPRPRVRKANRSEREMDIPGEPADKKPHPSVF